MNNFFFVNTYDKISTEIITQLLNTDPTIGTLNVENNSLMPKSIEITIDKFTKQLVSKQKKFMGNVGNFTAFEFQHKTLIEKTKTPLRRAVIEVSPILRIQFLIHSWLKSGLNVEQIVLQLEKQIMGVDKNNLLSLYNVSEAYTNVLNTLFINLQTSENTSQKDLSYYVNPENKLFLIALTLVVAFDTTDFPTLGRKFKLESLMNNELEMKTFLEHLTNQKINLTEEFTQRYNQSLLEVEKILTQLQLKPWENWQTNLLNSLLNKKINSVYGAAIDKPLAQFYNEIGYHFPTAAQTAYSKLVSIQLNSNRPLQLLDYFDNIEQTSDNPHEIEVLINIDADDSVMQSLLENEIPKRKFTLKYIKSSKPKSFFDLWQPLNSLLKITDPEAYFLLNVSDEMFFATQGWDTLLKKYVGFFPDHIFRLRASRNKFRNYFDRWECSFAQDCIPFTTQKWLRIVENWNPCFGPDSFQQLISYYLTKEGAFSNENYLRDIPLIDIKFTGDIPALGLSEEKSWKMFSDSIKAMQICQSYPMQVEAKRRAMLLKANIYAHNKQLPNPELVDLKDKKVIQLRVKDTLITNMSYKLSWVGITLTNQWRKIFFYHYFGGGFDMPVKPWVSFLHYQVSKHALALKIGKRIGSLISSCKRRLLQRGQTP